jgi:hypothetical protein
MPSKHKLAKSNSLIAASIAPVILGGVVAPNEFGTSFVRDSHTIDVRGHFSHAGTNFGVWDGRHSTGDDADRIEFDQLASRYLAETELLSSAHAVMLSPLYAQLVGFGPKALPWILAALPGAPTRWFPVLSAIARDNPVQPAAKGNVNEMIAAWQQWGASRGII